jgi:hypothetical protein
MNNFFVCRGVDVYQTDGPVAASSKLKTGDIDIMATKGCSHIPDATNKPQA